ncbi:MAG: hypothetical protein HY078_01110 [Elusimicrobia bacterium]|nr:hypothetical protein [Elusimicrobiota bacterium]
MRLLAALLLAAAAVRPAGAQTDVMPISDVQVRVSSASVKELDCHMRPFSMEYTRGVGRSYRKISREMIVEGYDPRPIAVGVFAMIVMVPFAILSPLGDLVVAPMRRECDFVVEVQGGLSRWAGQPPESARVAVQTRNVLDPGVQGVAPPVFFSRDLAAAADGNGRFSLSIPGHVGSDANYEMHWAVNGLESGAVVLTKAGGRFVLAEPEAAFGSPVQTLDPIEIIPARKKR